MPDIKLVPVFKTLCDAHSDYEGALGQLEAALAHKDYATAMTEWKNGHEAVLKLKDVHNSVYKHLSELKPVKADKMKPGGKLDNEPTKDSKKSKRNEERGRGAKKADTDADTSSSDDGGDADEP